MGNNGFALTAAHEWISHDPFGTVKQADSPGTTGASDNETVLQSAKNGYVSFRVLVKGKGEYTLTAEMDNGLETDMYRAWYHKMAPEEGKEESTPVYIPDALIPVREQETCILPDPDNNISGQTVQEFWIDIFVPADAPEGNAKGTVRLSAGNTEQKLEVTVNVIGRVIPDEPFLNMDHNSYGCSGVPLRYPEYFSGASGDEIHFKTIDILHHRYRLIHEHRGLLHNLCYSHSGSTNRIYHPDVVGKGRDKHLENWQYYDRHYGPLLDGTLFETAAPGMPHPRRKAAPVWSVYTPINPEWPASYLHFGEEGYDVEFVNCVRQFDEHLRENGWTGSHIEMFFNHKKRYRWFGWDGDEPKYSKDFAYHKKMGELFKQATDGSPVPWIYRSDTSWQMKNHWEALKGYITFWVCGRFVRWYPSQVKKVIERGDTVWNYGGLPSITVQSSAILENLFSTWALGLSGFSPWNTTSLGGDPWFSCTGMTEGILYPGERFGIPGPIPSIRMKIQRNGIQDVDLIMQANRDDQAAVDRLKRMTEENNPVCVWEDLPKAAVELPPEDWDSKNLQAEHEPIKQYNESLNPLWWQGIRDAALT